LSVVLPRLAALSLSVALVVGAATARARPIDLRRAQVGDGGVTAALGPGAQPVRLTLDPALQRAAERLLSRSGAHEGAIVASDVRTGRILAWASRGDRDYVVTPFAPSASLFKLVTATSLLEGGSVRPETRVCYEGGEHGITPRDLVARLGSGAACLPFRQALGRSINLVFARLTKEYLEAAELRQMAAVLGFSGVVPIDVPVGPSSVLLSSDPFELARAAAGFWNGKLSPLGALFAMQTIARGGERLPFSLLASTPPRAATGRAMSAATAATLRKMLEVTTRSGTCARAFRHADGRRALPDVSVAAKTGTLIGGKPTRMFSWFTAFAPSTRPEVAVAVMLGNDLVWRTKANVVGRDLLEAYFAHDKGGGAVAKRGGTAAKRGGPVAKKAALRRP
jgi:cell division protein FtsI/penicillin-binding protein 2